MWPVVVFAAHRLLMTLYVEVLPHRKLRKCPTYKHSRLLMQEWYVDEALAGRGRKVGRKGGDKTKTKTKPAGLQEKTTEQVPALDDAAGLAAATATEKAPAEKAPASEQPLGSDSECEHEQGAPKKPVARRRRRGVLTVLTSTIIRATCGTSKSGIICAYALLSTLQCAVTSAACILFWRYERVLLAHLGLLCCLALFNGGTLRAYTARKYRRSLETVVRAEHSVSMRRRCGNCGFVANSEELMSMPI